MASPTNTPFQPYVYQSPQAQVTPFQILGGESQIIQFFLKPGGRVQAEPGALCYMSGNMATDTTLGGGGFFRWLSGESFFTNMFLNRGPADGYVGIATQSIAKVLPIDLALYGGEVICQRDAYLCSINDVRVSVKLMKRIRVGFFGTNGFFLQRLAGTGLAFITAGGSIVQKNLAPGETVVVNASSVLAMTTTVDFDVKYVGSIMRVLFGGEGMFYAHMKGPGVVFLQSLPGHRQRTAARVAPAAGNANRLDISSFVAAMLSSVIFLLIVAYTDLVNIDIDLRGAGH
eukprot:TRINITY_DN18993_c0_g1_i1.p1 TRINITY_DN18993_c0_g1~~TRINITY_DN18993_c0_g1_i1.p1  ORF type:complete len:287 (+),score=48.34 TRINITY_DN18993_c0_g1_i1:130-990(+)